MLHLKSKTGTGSPRHLDVDALLNNTAGEEPEIITTKAEIPSDVPTKGVKKTGLSFGKKNKSATVVVDEVSGFGHQATEPITEASMIPSEPEVPAKEESPVSGKKLGFGLGKKNPSKEKPPKMSKPPKTPKEPKSAKVSEEPKIKMEKPPKIPKPPKPQKVAKTKDKKLPKPKPNAQGYLTRHNIDGQEIAIAHVKPKAGNIVFILLSIVLVLVGMFLCTSALSKSLRTVSELSDTELQEYNTVNNSVAALQKLSKELPQVEQGILNTINADTVVSSVIQEYLEVTGNDSGMVVQSITSFEKRNEFNTLKAYYQLEGVSDAQSLIKFLKDIQSYERAFLIEEVYLTEGTIFDFGDSNVSMIKDFRIVIQDAYPRDLISAESPNSKPNAGTAEESSNDSSDISTGAASSGVTQTETSEPALPQQSVEDFGKIREETAEHSHTYGDLSWVIIPTHTRDGAQVQICEVCGAVHQLSIPASEEYHSWGSGKCGSRICSVDGTKESGTDHLFGTWEVLSQAECYLVGIEQHTCLNPDCALKETREISKTEHQWVLRDGKQICGTCGLANTTGIEIQVATS